MRRSVDRDDRLTTGRHGRSSNQSLPTDSEVERAAASFGICPLRSVIRIGSGITNHTLSVESTRGTFILQRTDGVYNSRIQNVYSVAEYLMHEGIQGPQLIKTAAGSLSWEGETGWWRLMIAIPGVDLEHDPTATQAEAAGAFAARFHRALLGYRKPFVQPLPHFHDIRYHLNALRHLERTLRHAEAGPAIGPVVEEILQFAGSVADWDVSLPIRVCHGDLKLSNFRFDFAGNDVVALLDFDTLGRYLLPLEVGDMLRSFCMTRHEHGSVSADPIIWEAALRGYCSSGRFLAPEEAMRLARGCKLVTAILAARWTVQAYCQWSGPSERCQIDFDTCAEMVRARSALALLRDLSLNSAHFEDVTRAIFRTTR
jgi:N-acetylhexosamine 1-kinase